MMIESSKSDPIALQSPWVDDQTFEGRWKEVEKLKGGGQGKVSRARPLLEGVCNPFHMFMSNIFENFCQL